ncbi:hypothetical protein N7451_010745 [Penicillium sp. IBT 35674x]|nr:hypothetical protein N7451_010745 [Penicillium sp. IBT 35674x]
MHQTPMKDVWKTYRAWHLKYGPIIFLQYGQQTVISLGSYKVAKDLLDKRSVKYSSRPRLVIANYINRLLHTAILKPGKLLEAHQSMHASILNPRMSQQYQYVQDLESKQLLYDMICSSGRKFQKSFHRYTFSTIFTLAYGQRVPDIENEIIRQLDAIASTLAKNLQRPSYLIVEAFPVLDYLPRPLAPWKRMGDKLFKESSELFIKLFRGGLATKSWNWAKEVSQMNDAKFSLSIVELSFVLGSLLEASLTTDKVLEFFILASVLHRAEVQRAQQEIDSIVGEDRLPNFDDAARLPYLNAFIHEVLRWRPITPLSVPHAVTEDDMYEGYHIPKGSTVLANNWAMDLDQNVFEDPESFQPERWLATPNYPSSSFGFGKRICPGQHLGRRSLFIVICRLLWGFDISEAVDSLGNTIKVNPEEMLQSSLSGPVDLRAQLVVRSHHHRALIEKEFANLNTDVDLILQHVGP